MGQNVLVPTRVLLTARQTGFVGRPVWRGCVLKHKLIRTMCIWGLKSELNESRDVILPMYS